MIIQKQRQRKSEIQLLKHVKQKEAHCDECITKLCVLTILCLLQLRSNEDINPAHCWVSLEVAHGAFNGADCQHDMVQLKFDRAVSLKVSKMPIQMQIHSQCPP